MGTESTTPRANWIELSLVCALFVALALIGIIWEITSGLLTSGIDGIMLLAICLMMGGIFSLMILMMVYQAGVLPFFRARPAAQTAPKAAATPAPTATKAAASVPATSPAAAPPLQTSHPPAAVEPGYPEPAPAPKPAAKPAPPAAAKPQDN